MIQFPSIPIKFVSYLTSLVVCLFGMVHAEPKPDSQAVTEISTCGLAVVCGSSSPVLSESIAADGRWLVLQLVADEKQRGDLMRTSRKKI